MLQAEAVPVDEQDYKSEAEEVADLLADNRINELAELDYKMVNDLRLAIREPRFFCLTRGRRFF
jgi:hypothetical protein